MLHWHHKLLNNNWLSNFFSDFRLVLKLLELLLNTFSGKFFQLFVPFLGFFLLALFCCFFGLDLSH